MQTIALDMLPSLFHKHERNIFFVIDETQTLKRGKKMHTAGKLRHHATGKYGFGHTIVKVCLYCRGVTIPWGSWLYVKKEHVKSLKLVLHKLTDLAAQAIREAHFPATFKVTVLFDAFYLRPTVVNACKEKGWHYIGVGKSNRWFTVGSFKHKLGRYGKNVLRNSGQWYTITGLRKTKAYRLAQRVGTVNKLGTVKVVFSGRRGESQHLALITALITDNLQAPMKTIVTDYLKKCSIEMLIKDEKEHLGLGDYGVIRYQAIVRHLHLVDVAYACLIHAAIKACRAQGQSKNKKVLRLEPVSKLKDRVRRITWQQNVQDAIKYSREKPVIRRLERLLAG